MIVGKKIKLRPIEEEDLSLLVQWFNDPEIAQLVGGWDFPISLAQQKEWFKRAIHDRNNQRWIIESKAGEKLGLTGLWDIDWHSRHALGAVKLGIDDVRGKGYGTDVIMTTMGYAFHEMGLNRLWGEIIEYNIASYKAYVVNCGWKVEGVLRQHVYRNGRYYDLLRVGILRNEFMIHPRAKEYMSSTGEERIEVSKSHLAREWAERID